MNFNKERKLLMDIPAIFGTDPAGKGAFAVLGNPLDYCIGRNGVALGSKIQIPNGVRQSV
jgi:hypothetical protein